MTMDLEHLDPQAPRPVQVRDLEEAAGQLQSLKLDYLTRWGWKQTSNTPGAYWLWVRDFSAEDANRHARWKAAGPGPLGWPSEPKPMGRITADTDLAIKMTQRSLDDRPEEEPGDDD